MGLLERFEAKVSPEPTSGCWLWTAVVDPKGYGRIGGGGRADGVLAAHRVAFFLYHGRWPEEGLVLDHLCRNPSCVSPHHLEEVTRAENNRRGEPASRQACPQGHPYDERNTYRNPTHGKRQCRECHRLAERARR